MQASTNESRRAVWSSVKQRLASLDDVKLMGVLAAAAKHGAGIGGVTSVVDVDGVSVFTKVVPLTGREREPGNVRSTHNLFNLPPFCQYGLLGSPGFTAWRELEAHQRATQWVLDEETGDFPLLYHWRVLPVEIPDPIDEHGDRDTAVAYWHGAPGVADRLAALGGWCEEGRWGGQCGRRGGHVRSCGVWVRRSGWSWRRVERSGRLRWRVERLLCWSRRRSGVLTG